jgi:hypothetical protein
MTAWIDHVKAYAQKHKCSYKEALSRSRPSYKPMSKSSTKKKGGAIMRPPPTRMIGGAKMMPLPQLKHEVKKMGHKLSRIVNGVRKAYNKNELIKMLVQKGEKMQGGKVSRIRKAQKWTNYAEDTARRGLNLAKDAQGMFGGKISRIRKAQKWTDYAEDTARRGLNLAREYN